MELPKASQEQQGVLKALSENKNVIVDSVAGSGKTTCILHIVNSMKDKQILLLTYNSKLRLETRQKAKQLKLPNIEVHTYHSFAYKYYHTCKNDLELHNILVKEKVSKTKMNFDILILDETQDMTLLYYKLVSRLVSDMYNKNPQICILGDRYQSIYDFNKADNRFIILADKLFGNKESQWAFLNLSQTFRCTHEMTQFINHCMLGYQRLLSNKSNNHLPRYIYADAYGEDINHYCPYDELVYYFKNGYKPEDIFIIAPSVRSERTPIRALENVIKLKMPHIPIYVPISDDEKIDEDILKNKLVFSTFHQVKGLERKVVIVFCFDESYFVYYKKDVSPHVCPNELYVATTRASERMSLFHDRTYGPLPFLNESNINRYCTVIGSTGPRKEQLEDKRLKPIGVTDLLRFCTYEVLQECCKFFRTYKIRETGEFIDIPCKIKQVMNDVETFENVSDITGISIPTYFEMMTNQKCTIANNLLTFHGKNKKVVQICLEANDKLDKITPDKLLNLSNLWSAFTTGYRFKLDQISEYNWLSDDLLTKCMDRFKTLEISNHSTFEKEIKYNTDLIKHSEINGYIDCIDVEKKNVYEFKCVQELKDEHFIQLAIYKLMYSSLFEKDMNYYLYNILSDELYVLEATTESLKRMVRVLENNKNAHMKKDNDTLFIEKTLAEREKMSSRREKTVYYLDDCKDIMFIDLETDGKTIVQISYIITDENYTMKKEFDKIINTGTIISNYTSMIHKITTEISRTKGVPFKSLLEEIKKDLLGVRTVYTHNAAFDIGVLVHNLEEIQRYDMVDLVESKQVVCTMKTFKEYVDARDINDKQKKPKLEEFYRKVFGKNIPQNEQHNSLYDTRYLYYAVRETYKNGILEECLNKKEECMIGDKKEKKQTMEELKEICKQKGIKGYSKLKREELIHLIEDHKEPVIVKEVKEVKEEPVKVKTIDSYFKKK
jgi:DNA polymerase III epsilon subunit-like protein